MPEIRRAEASGVGIITISNISKANCITASMKTELIECWDWIQTSDIIRIAVIMGDGNRHFCGGADMARLAGNAQAGSPVDISSPFAPKMLGVTKPIIAALTGAVVGASIGLVADCDIVIASNNSFLTDPHLDLGIISAYSGLRLAAKVSPNEAARLVLGGKSVRMTARRAYELGLVNELYDEPQAAKDRAVALASHIASLSPWAVSTSLQFFREFVDDRQETIDAALEVSRTQWRREDVRSGTSAWGQNAHRDSP